MGDDYSRTERFVVRLRGLPWSATHKDIEAFLYGCNVANGNAINRTMSKEGRSSGEAYVELASEEDYNRALEKDRECIGRRYIEVFAATADEMEFILGKSFGKEDYNIESSSDSIVRMRGLPFQCTKEDIAQFFTGLDIVPNGIKLQVDGTGRCSGTAFVEFSNAALVERALGKHKEKIGHRYIELYKSSGRELKATMQEFMGNQRQHGGGGGGGGGGRGRPGPYDRPMRGNRGAQGNHGGFYNNRGGRGGRMMGDGNWGDNNYSNNFDNNYDDDYTWDDDSYGRETFGGGGGNQRNNFRGGSGGNRRGGNRGGGGGGWNMRNGDWQNQNEYYDDNEGISSDYVVHMLGLPFKATDQEIIDFFSPVVPLRVHREYGRDGRITGEANVEFASFQDAQAAMLKDKDLIQHRYIELFLRDGSEIKATNNRQQRGYGNRGGNRGRGRSDRYY